MDTRLLRIRHSRLKCGGDYRCSQSDERRGTDFSTFKNSRCNPRYWNRTAGGGFELKAGVSPSAAINDIFVNGQLYAFECAMAMVMILYRATISMIGENAFDRYFTDLYLWDWNYDSNLKMITTFNPSELQPGM